MIPFRVPMLCCALTLAMTAGARAGEVNATEVCHRGRTSCSPTVTVRAKPCYDPCEPVGPVRRFFRRVFLPKCPPPCPAPCPGPVVQAPRGVFVPPPPAPLPPANLGRPVPQPQPQPPPPPAESPFPGAASRPGRLTPPAAPLPVRLDRLASRSGQE
jgi:hypothetical protein